jgi:hypothetical protein
VGLALTNRVLSRRSGPSAKAKSRAIVTLIAAGDGALQSAIVPRAARSIAGRKNPALATGNPSMRGISAPQFLTAAKANAGPSISQSRADSQLHPLYTVFFKQNRKSRLWF